MAQPLDAGLARKVAVLLNTLEADLAASILDEFPTALSNQIAEVASEGVAASDAELSEILAELHQVQVGEQKPADDTSSCPDRGNACHAVETMNQLLCEFGEKEIARLLAQESPTVVASLFARLEGSTAGNVLTLLPPEMQTQVMLRVAEQPPQIAEGVLHEIVATIRAHLTKRNSTSCPEQPGLARLERLLSTINQHDRTTLVRRLAKENQVVAASLNGLDRAGEVETKVAANGRTQPPPCPYRFADLERFDNRTLKTIIRNVPQHVLALALLAADGRFVERVMGLLPLLRLRPFQRKMRALGPMRLSDVEQAQRRIAELVAEMERAGKIDPGAGSRHLNMAA